jgi:hypothetical protein
MHLVEPVSSKLIRIYFEESDTKCLISEGLAKLDFMRDGVVDAVDITSAVVAADNKFLISNAFCQCGSQPIWFS